MRTNDPIKSHGRFAWILHGFGLLGVVCAVAIAYFIFFRPMDGQRQSFAERTTKLEKLLSTADQVRTDHRRRRVSLTKVQLRAEALARRVTAQPREDEFLRQVATAAKSTGVSLKTFNPGPHQDKNGYSQMTIDLSGQGSYAGICGFLDDVDHLPRLSKVSQLTVSPSEAEESYPFTLTLVVYYNLKLAPVAALKET